MSDIPDGVYDPVTVPTEKLSVDNIRGVPEPVETIESLQQSVAAMKELLETLLGLRGGEGGGLVGYLDRVLDDHTRLESPYKTHPHPQYWHKIVDAGFGAISINTEQGLFSGGDIIAATKPRRKRVGRPRKILTAGVPRAGKVAK